MLKFTHTQTRHEFDSSDMPQIKLMNRKTIGGICVCSCYNQTDPYKI